MATGWRTDLKALWRRSSALDRIAVLLIVLLVAFWVAKLPGWQLVTGTSSLAADFLSLLLLGAALIFLLVRTRHWVERRLLWSLRNRLILAYINIAVVPIILLLAMGGILGYMGEVEVAAHLLHEDMNGRMDQMAAISREALALARLTAPRDEPLRALGSSPPIRLLEELSRPGLRGLMVDFVPASPESGATTSPAERSEIVEQFGRLWLEGATIGQLSDSRWVEARARLPVTQGFMDALAARLGPVTFGRPTEAPPSPNAGRGRGELLGPDATASIASRDQTLPPPRNPLDIRIIGATTFDAFRYAGPGSKPVPLNLVATFATRSSLMRSRVEGSLGEFASFYVILLLIAGGLFVVLWLLSLIAGMVLTRTITRVVSKLDEATHHVKARDFSHRISIVHRDQLGALAESFNSMTASIEDLLDEQRQHERLENEVSIAREVQSQLFPQKLPEIPGLELGAVCRAARMVSGDYYDCLQLDSQRVAMVVADVSGKGISAALVMASLNAALRGLVLSNGNVELNTAALAGRLNRHLLVNTPEDRYATLFLAVYDGSTHTLHYTNAGHLPPFLITDNRVEKLERGGTVIGLLDHCEYEQASIPVTPGTLLVAYSDGITEPESPYGEEFGADRLIEEVLRHRDDPPARLCNDLVEAVKNWCAPAEPFDDQTVLIARMR